MTFQQNKPAFGRRLLSLLLLCSAAAVPCVMTACGDAGTAPEVKETQNAVTQSAVTDAETEEVVRAADDLPERDYGGMDLAIFTRINTTHYQFVVEEQNADILNDAIYMRNLKIGERFNVKFSEQEYETETDAEKLVLAGDDTYSLMNVRCTAANNMAQKGYSLDISDLEYINLDKPYWDKEVTDSIAIGGKRYVAIGSSDLTAVDFMTILLYNKRIAESYDIGDIYPLVREGKWTLDKLREITMSVSSDLNGDGIMNEEDQWGMLGCAKYLHVSLLLGGDVLMCNKGADGFPVYTIPTDPRFVDVYNKVLDVCNESGAWYQTKDDTNEAVKYHEMFRAGQGMFMSTLFYYLETMRDMKDEFGIVPFPKYNEQQEQYRNRISFYDATIIPTSAKDPECSSIILEALNCESYNSVLPAYYDIALKNKYTRDPDSAEMLDIIMANRVLDIGDTFYQSEIRDGFVAPGFMNNSRNIVSTAEKKIKSMTKLFDKMRDAYDELANN
ncbi:MAG: hypothetical protein MJ175_09855 [Clostridia bacterium]|nr:hypothetical protein [Clostridia bacterium]